ncbi:hypothetical protein A2U01_0052080, partial [Trifolium medium]|nr:hypothetical protein [Trifolium medium]
MQGNMMNKKREVVGDGLDDGLGVVVLRFGGGDPVPF